MNDLQQLKKLTGDGRVQLGAKQTARWEANGQAKQAVHQSMLYSHQAMAAVMA